MTKSASSKLENLERALKKLNSFANRDAFTEIERSGVIQAFEFTFELFWKVFKECADQQGITDALAPRSALRAAFQLGLITDQTLWLDCLADRNQTSHTYNEELAEFLLHRIKDRYLQEFNRCLPDLKKTIEV